jgi:hypothetical protein
MEVSFSYVQQTDHVVRQDRLLHHVQTKRKVMRGLSSLLYGVAVIGDGTSRPAKSFPHFKCKLS